MIRSVLALGALWFAIAAAAAPAAGPGGPGTPGGNTPKPAVQKLKLQHPKPPPVKPYHNSDPTLGPAAAPH